MTKCEFTRKNGRYIGFKFSGHVGIDSKGKDVVCAAVSAVVQATIIGIAEVLEEDISYIIKDAKIECRLKSTSECAQKMVETLHRTAKQLAAQYPKNLSVMEVKR